MMEKISSRIEEIPPQEIWTPEARWTISHTSGEITFLFPAFGPGTYNEVVGQVRANREKGLHLPRGEQSALMLDEAYNSIDKSIKKNFRTEFIRTDIMRHGWLWVPHINVWTPTDAKNPGMYSVFDQNGEGLTRKYTTEELEERLTGGDIERGVRFSHDRTVAFAPRGSYSAGEHRSGTLARNGAFIAVYGSKGAEALDSVAKQFKRAPYSWVVDNSSSENIQTLSALGRNFSDGGLGAGFNTYGGSREGYVLSVSGSEK